jgi:hypothetical protein
MSQVSGRQRQGDGTHGDRAPEAKAVNTTRSAAPGDLTAETDLRPDTTATCNAPGCNATTLIAVTLGGRRITLDPDPHPDGTITIVRTPNGDIRARILTGADLPAQRVAWMPHDRTCPAGIHRARRATATTPKCRACGLPMDPWLPANGWNHHILCAPPPDFRAQVHAARQERTT